jgi:class 3 adenylate cyclase/tetratricopeptide (TPR) repeat protein
MTECPSCHAANRDGAKFCAKCGHALGLACPSCGAPYQAGDVFCVECGSSLDQPSARRAASPVRAAPASEHRLVSVLFADLVGFTTLSESRDSEEVRELLSSYFELARTVLARYGGTVEKFIGDAVMAVWGTPTATEDDAERAVRAALEFVASVPDLDPGLNARGGVLTGEAAVTIGAEGQGMVAGDLVNTASRIQSSAEPGTVLVGESTRRASAQAIAYEDAGLHELKGKSEPVALWRALRVVSGVGGTLKSAGLEAPFVGRERELKLIKDLFHASAEDRKAHLVSVAGIAGTGKSRLVWEFYKYFDGLVELVRWHRGRCLAYGEGVAYWALADMVRMRCGISEEERPEPAREKLRTTLEEHVPDPEERSYVEPRLAHLLGLEERSGGDRQDLFAAWRLFFERLADVDPVVLAFEDMQWADAGLLDFIEYLLEWSRDHPLFVITLGRPELQQRRPGWGAGQRSFTSLYLEALPQSAMQELLEGLAPGLPESLRDQILARAEGVPLYAMETVRMLLDRDLLRREGDVYLPTGEIAQLDVPETLHALVAARLDGLAPAERRLLQDGSVLGKTFTRQAVSAVSGVSDPELDPLLESLVRKEIVGVQADPRSPERGQYGFLQDLVRRVAYETLSKKERKGRHLTAAEYLQESWGGGEQEIVEVIASHYLAAYEALPDADDADEIRGKAREQLAQAGERSASLGAGEAQRYFEQAAGLADEPGEQARLLERAGVVAVENADFEAAERLFGASLTLRDEADEAHAAARLAGRLGYIEFLRGRSDSAIERMERAFSTVSQDEPDEDLAILAVELARVHTMMGNYDAALERTELALRLAEALRLPEVLCAAIATKGSVAGWRGQTEERAALVRHALRLALEHDIPDQALRAYSNLSDLAFRRDRYGEALEHLAENLALARRVGSRRRELFALAESTYPLFMSGRWEEALAAFGELPEEQLRTNSDLTTPLQSVLEIHLHRGQLEEARAVLDLFAYLEEGTDDMQNRSMYAGARAAVLRAGGHLAEALAAGSVAAEMAADLDIGFQGVKQGFVEAVEAALALGEQSRASELLAAVETLEPGLRPPYLEAQAHRFRARLDDAEPHFKTAEQLFREYGIPFWLAVAQVEHAEWLTAHDRAEDAAPLLAEARETFERLEARPWLERVEQVGIEVAA